MRAYFLRRLLLIPPTLIGVTLVVFIITRFVPGGPVDQALAQARAASMEGGGGGATSGAEQAALSEEQINKLKEYYGFDKPWYQAYPIWLGKVCRGDFGISHRFTEPVWSVIKERLPVSMYYGLVTLVITYLVCIPLGMSKAVRHNSFFDTASSILVFIGYAVPGYALGAVLLYFAIRLEWFPSSGFKSFDHDDLSPGGQVLDILHHSVLPLICYLVSAFAVTTFLMKNTLMDNLAADYVRTAVAKGVSFKNAVRKHAFRNSLIPMATGLGHQVSALIAGSFLIETIFDIDGFGLLGFESVVHRDYPVVMAIVLISAFLAVLGNILADLLVALTDPRVRFK